jgi:hypothetical protein
MLTDTILHVWPRPGGKTSAPRIMRFTILVYAFLLYITMHLVFLTYMWFERKFKKKMIDFDAFCPAPKGQGI